MSLDFELREQCVICGYWLQGVQFASGCRINKTSIRIERSLIVLPMGHGNGRCPECGTYPHEGAQVRRFLSPESQAKVDAYRAKRGWVAA